MNRYFLICLSLFFSSLQGENIKTIKTKPSKATVFLYGAELTHSEYITLNAGNNEIIFEGTAPDADESSLSAFFKGALVIDVRKEQKYPESPKTMEMDAKYNSIINSISDSIVEMDFLMKDFLNKMTALDKEKYLLLNNRLMKGEFLRDSIPLLKASLDLMRTRLNDIDQEHLSLERKHYKADKLKKEMEARVGYYTLLVSQNLNNMNINQYKAINRIIVTIESEATMSGNLNVRYFVAAAGWLPRYDISAGSSSDKLELVYRAQVYQNTQLDWNNISLTLSTSNPSQGNSKPELSKWDLVYGYPNSYINQKKLISPQPNNNYNYLENKPTMKTKKMNSAQEDFDGVAMGDDVSQAEPAFTMDESMMRVEYTVKTKYNIASDNKAHNVIINKESVPVSYTFAAVPKLDNEAFLMGKVINWEDLNLLPALARLYFDDSYLGNTVVNPNSFKDTMYLNLGRDKTIKIKRQNLKDKCKEQIIGDDKIIVKTIEITIRNTKTVAMDFELEDQIPVAGVNTIKIELLKSDDAEYNELTGKLTWKLKIKPKETKKIVFSYQVKHPKSNVIGTPLN